MRIGIDTNALHAHTAYAIQARHLARRLRDDGHQVAIFAFYGVRGAILNIDGFPHYPAGRLEYNADVIEQHCADWQTDVLITLCDLAHQDPAAFARLRAAGVKVLHWVPVDCEPLSVLDEAVLKIGGGTPVAMSRFGERMLAGAGLVPLYAPHCVDTDLFRPVDGGRDEMREAAGVGQRFAVAINAMSKDSIRKGFFEAYEGFAAFHVKHPKSVILLHSEQEGSQFDHAEFAQLAGIASAFIVSEDYKIKTGRLDDQYMAQWTNLADVYLCASWGEGFGVPVVEAQACGVPVIATDCSALTELVQPGTGWRVPSELKPNPLHKRRWRAPWIKGITQALESAHRAWEHGGSAWAQRQSRAREFALAYDADAVYAEYWRPIVKDLAEPERITVHSGLKWVTDDGGFEFGDRLALDHESALEPHVFKGLPADGVFLDVGAHVGHWALRAAKRCARVIAVEANPGTAARLEENARINGLANVTVHQVAAWDFNCSLFVHNHHGGAERDGTDQVKPDPGGTEVLGVRLDELLAAEERVDVVKIDVEGADLHVLRGLAGLLERCKPRLFIEDHAVYGMYQKAHLSDLLDELGYEWRDITLGYLEAWPAGGA